MDPRERKKLHGTIFGQGRFKYQPIQGRAFGMMAGGSGITPMFQVARAILEIPNDKTNVHLAYANVTYDDILLEEELDGLASNYGRFRVYHALNQPLDVWNGGDSFVSKDMIQANCPAPASDIQILRCGSPPEWLHTLMSWDTPRRCNSNFEPPFDFLGLPSLNSFRR